jgi:hypothetical protein
LNVAPAAESDVRPAPASPPTPSEVPDLLDERVPEWMGEFHVPGVSIVGIGFRCYCEFDRAQGTGIVIMTNAIGGRELWQRVIAAVAPP